MQKILFPTDFSPAANHAFVYALHLANKLKGEITTLHAYPVPEIHGVVMPNLIGEIEQSIQMEEFDDYKKSVDHLRKIADDQKMAHLPVDHTMHTGSTIRTILVNARSKAYDLIVMGTKGATGLREVFVGSIAGEVMEKAPCPVLVIPDEAVFDNNIDRIVITTDLTDEDEKAMLEVLKFAALFDRCQVICVHVCKEGQEQKESEFNALKWKYRGNTNLHFEMLVSRDILEALNEFLELNQVDVVAMLTHKRSFFKELFNYSRAKRLIYHSRIPLLSIPAEILH